MSCQQYKPSQQCQQCKQRIARCYFHLWWYFWDGSLQHREYKSISFWGSGDRIIETDWNFFRGYLPIFQSNWTLNSAFSAALASTPHGNHQQFFIFFFVWGLLYFVCQQMLTKHYHVDSLNMEACWIERPVIIFTLSRWGEDYYQLIVNSHW